MKYQIWILLFYFNGEYSGNAINNPGRFDDLNDLQELLSDFSTTQNVSKSVVVDYNETKTSFDRSFTGENSRNLPSNLGRFDDLTDLADLLSDFSTTQNVNNSVFYNETQTSFVQNSTEDSLKDIRDLLRNIFENQQEILQKLKSQNLKSAENSTEDISTIDIKGLLKNISDSHREIIVKMESPNSSIGALSSFIPKRYLTRDCAELFQAGKRSSGIYKVKPCGWNEQDGFQVYCDMETDGGGWTVFQRRSSSDDWNYEEAFYKTWIEYEDGFGDLKDEFWLGNRKINALTSQKQYTLRVDLKDLENNTAYARYNEFKVQSNSHSYRLQVNGYSGTAGDSLSANANMKFSTRDRDNDPDPSHCAQRFKGAWWYTWNCLTSNLNGLNLQGNTTRLGEGIVWAKWKTPAYSLYSTEMKIRPLL